MDGPTPADSDRLPWLEPYREAPARPARPKSRPKPARSSAWPLLALLGAAALGSGGYWIGRSDAPVSVVTAPLPPTPVPAPLPYRTLDERLTDDGEDVSAEPPPAVEEPPRIAKARPKPRAVRAEPRLTRLAETRRRQQSAPPPPRPVRPPPRRLAAPLTNQPVGKPGQVLYLGSFITPWHADGAYLRLVARYPYLGTLPRAIAPNPRGSGRPTVYQLKIGAGSKRNARRLCKNLISIGRGCRVV